MKKLSKLDDNARITTILGMPGWKTIKRDFVQPVPIGGYVVTVFRVSGYSRDCDGSALAELEQVDFSGKTTGWTQNGIGLYEETDLVVDHPSDMLNLIESSKKPL